MRHLVYLLLLLIFQHHSLGHQLSLETVSKIDVTQSTQALSVLKQLLLTTGLDKDLLSQYDSSYQSLQHQTEDTLTLQDQTVLLALLHQAKNDMKNSYSNPPNTEMGEKDLLLKLLLLISLDGDEPKKSNAMIPESKYASELVVLKKILLLFATTEMSKGSSGGVIEGYPEEDEYISAEHLDFNPFAVDSDFVIDVVGLEGNIGTGGIVQARESPNTPAMVGQGIALSLFTVQPGGQNLIHYHPRATELLYVINGTIEVGSTDTTGRLIANVIQPGQATLFPKALLHFQRNVGTEVAQYISMLNSENPGVMSIPRVFATLPTYILAQALRTNVSDIQQFQGDVIPEKLRNKRFKGVTGMYDGVAGPNGNAPVEGDLTFLPDPNRFAVENGGNEPVVIPDDPNDAAANLGNAAVTLNTQFMSKTVYLCAISVFIGF